MMNIHFIYRAVTLTCAFMHITHNAIASSAIIDIAEGKIATDAGANTIHLISTDTLIKKGEGTLFIAHSQAPGMSNVNSVLYGIEGMVDFQEGIIRVGHKDALGAGNTQIPTPSNLLKMSHETKLEFGAELGAVLSTPVIIDNHSGTASIVIDFNQCENNLPFMQLNGNNPVILHFKNSPVNNESNMKDLNLLSAYLPGTDYDLMIADSDVNLVVGNNMNVAVTEMQHIALHKKAKAYTSQNAIAGFKLSEDDAFSDLTYTTANNLQSNPYVIYNVPNVAANIYHLYIGKTEAQTVDLTTDQNSKVYIKNSESSVASGFKLVADSTYSKEVELHDDSDHLVMNSVADRDLYYTISNNVASAASFPVPRLAPNVEFGCGAKLTITDDVTLPFISFTQPV